MNVHLIDGTFELFRCFHGAPRHRLEDGREVGAIRGLLWTLVSLLGKPEVTHVGLAFDGGIVGGPRRGAVPDDAGPTALLQGQYGLAEEVVRALGILMWPMARRFQADDALATAADRVARDERVDRVVICTTDKDLAQCVDGDRVVLLDRIRKMTTDEAGVRERFGVPPASIPDWFALVGDPSDGLPGLPGWGARSAATVLARYEQIEAIPRSESDWDVKVRGAARLATTLRERYREAVLHRDLSILRRDVPLRDVLDDLRWRGAVRERLEPLVELLGEPEVLPRIARWRS